MSLSLTVEEAALQQQQQQHQRIEDALLRFVEEHPNSTQEQILGAATGKTEQKKRAFSRLHELQLLTRAGEGHKGDPYRYSMFCTEANQASPIVQPNQPVEVYH
jgi:hypothetical protein